MKIAELFVKKKPVVSFEIFPPKPDYPVETIFDTLEQLKRLDPDFISVTYGAGGSNAGRSIDIAGQVKNKYGIESVAHLTCVNSTREQIDDILAQLRSLKVENVLALRGDPPAGQTTFAKLDGGYGYAKDLIAHIRQRGEFSIAAAAYPEGHLECRDLSQDLKHLKDKVDQGVDLLITQLFFDNEKFYSFQERAHKLGIFIPVCIGIMPVLNASQVKRITALCGASIPEKLEKIMAKYGAEPKEMEKAGIDYACSQIVDLVANGAAGIHLYTMNKAEQTKQIVEEAGLR